MKKTDHDSQGKKDNNNSNNSAEIHRRTDRLKKKRKKNYVNPGRSRFSHLSGKLG